MNELARVSVGGDRLSDTARGDDQCADLFFRDFARLVVLARFLGAADPEDVAQEAFARLHERIGRLHDADAAAGYVRKVVINLVRAEHRSRLTRRRHVVPAWAWDRVITGPDEAVGNPVLADAVAALPSREREAVALRFWLDLPYEQIGEVMGVSAGTARSHVSHAISSLRTMSGEDVHG